ncbi:hypothetical protein RT717_19875 [Imperialibacter roseus]|uniref:Uncharacterized protein n=1 Tax=Imperialibacter roseus TaxID=1324217 RepID=A0ABZ0IJZ4_9BACT|nr:hypothetical protein [Imperialibacter roseus]WOK05342.1 hypothetical protein RT717_19875 [Imperialibacter roseus]
MKNYFKVREDTVPKLKMRKKKQEDFVSDKKEETMATAEKGRLQRKSPVGTESGSHQRRQPPTTLKVP